MRLVSHLRIALVGFLMGCADVVPGVSGGTIAFICGIYERLINGIKSLDLTTLRLVLRADWRGAWDRVPVVFFLCLSGGLLVAIVSMARVLAHLMLHHPIPLWSFFFGLVLASIGLLARQTWSWRAGDWALFIVFAVATYFLVGLSVLRTPEGLPFIFLAGAIAICAMILPGISGSYLLVILGQYPRVLDAVNQRDLVTLAVFCAGIATGILSFVRVVSWLLRTHRHATLIALTGVMAGALRTLWPWKATVSTRINSAGEEVPLLQANVAPAAAGGQLGLALALLGAGLLAVFLVERLAAAESHEAGPTT
jgi:putative membrane protein